MLLAEQQVCRAGSIGGLTVERLELARSGRRRTWQSSPCRAVARIVAPHRARWRSGSVTVALRAQAPERSLSRIRSRCDAVLGRAGLRDVEGLVRRPQGALRPA